MFNPVSEALFIPSEFTCPSKSGENLGKPSSAAHVLSYISTTFKGYRLSDVKSYTRHLSILISITRTPYLQ
jgi:hypothetical protein